MATFLAVLDSPVNSFRYRFIEYVSLLFIRDHLSGWLIQSKDRNKS